MPNDHYDHDKDWTKQNRDRLFRNRNLLLWYQKLYEIQFSGIEELSSKAILEVGSGTSPLKHFYPNVITSDVLYLDYLDYHFDCLEIEKFSEIEDSSIDIISMTNVLHHLKEPIAFLHQAVSKLKNGGRVIFLEPYFSLTSTLIYKLLHHEASDFGVAEPLLKNVKGPLSTSNMALPQLIFLSDNYWDKGLKELYCYSAGAVRFFSGLSYLVTGGISRSFPIPHALYKMFLPLDLWVARKFPKIFASFFLMEIRKRGSKNENEKH